MFLSVSCPDLLEDRRGWLQISRVKHIQSISGLKLCGINQLWWGEAERPCIMVSAIQPPTEAGFCQSYVNSWSSCFITVLQTAVENVFWVKLKTSFCCIYFLNFYFKLLKTDDLKREALFFNWDDTILFWKDWNEAWKVFFLGFLCFLT